MASAAPDLTRPLLLVLTALLGAQAAAWPLAMAVAGHDGLRSPGMAWAAYGILVVTSSLMLATGWRRPDRLPSITSWYAASAAFALVLGGLATTAGYGTAYSHPTVALGVGAGVAVALVRPGPRAWPWVAGITIAYLVGVGSTLALGVAVLSSLAVNLASLVGIPVGAGVLARRWFRVGAERDAARVQLAAADGRLSLAHDRELERGQQYRLIHDTVLSSLSALSRGTLDPADPQVRQRLTAEADYLRGLIATSDSAAGMYLVGELARATRELAASGLRVHPNIDSVPDFVPTDVARALADSLREALTNVVKHAGRPEAWVTIVGLEPTVQQADSETPGPRIAVTVTDRGAGFDPARATRGLGLVQSIGGRMRSVGGAAEIDSAPGQGTSVELLWPT